MSLREIDRLAADAVDGDWTAEVAARLVRVPSVTGDERAVQDLVASLASPASSEQVA